MVVAAAKIVAGIVTAIVIAAVAALVMVMVAAVIAVRAHLRIIFFLDLIREKLGEGGADGRSLWKQLDISG